MEVHGGIEGIEFTNGIYYPIVLLINNTPSLSSVVLNFFSVQLCVTAFIRVTTLMLTAVSLTKRRNSDTI